MLEVPHTKPSGENNINFTQKARLYIKGLHVELYHNKEEKLKRAATGRMRSPKIMGLGHCMVYVVVFSAIVAAAYPEPVLQKLGPHSIFFFTIK